MNLFWFVDRRPHPLHLKWCCSISINACIDSAALLLQMALLDAENSTAASVLWRGHYGSRAPSHCNHPLLTALVFQGLTQKQGGTRFDVYAISDLHTDHKENLNWIRCLSTEHYRNDALIVAGDISDCPNRLRSLNTMPTTGQLTLLT